MVYYVVRPTAPSVTVTAPLVDGSPITTLATCSTSGFRPKLINVTWQLQGGSIEVMADTSTVRNGVDNTFSVTSEYRRVVSNIDNGKTLMCTVNHETLHVPLSMAVVLDISCNKPFLSHLACSY